MPSLACTVRGCGRPLEREARTFRCEQGHSFDIAREGYINLLQPQDRRSLNAGDSREAVEARAALLGAGIGTRNLTTTIELAEPQLLRGDPPVVVDLGSGSGEALAHLVSMPGRYCGVGIDLSTAAAAHAARRFRTKSTLTWLVANADRDLPLADASVHLVMSIQARRNPAECRRILVDQGRLVVSVPAPDDLVELREHVQGAPAERDRVADLIREHDPWFRVVNQTRVFEKHTLDRHALLNFLHGTYRGGRTSQASRVESLDRLEVTLSADVVLFQKR